MRTQHRVTRLHERQIDIGIAYQTLASLGNVGFDPAYGARPLRRAIQAQLENPSAMSILAAEFVGGDTIRVDGEHAKRVFHALRKPMVTLATSSDVRS